MCLKFMIILLPKYLFKFGVLSADKINYNKITIILKKRESLLEKCGCDHYNFIILK